MTTEGSKVNYVGDNTFIGVGSLGTVLASGGPSSCHVQWREGSREGQVDLIPHEDLVVVRSGSYGLAGALLGSADEDFEATLDVPSLVSLSVRETYDTGGEDGLIDALDEAGHLSSLSAYASDAIATVAGRIRQDPAFSSVLAQLDEDEAEALLSRVAVDLIRGGEEE